MTGVKGALRLCFPRQMGNVTYESDLTELTPWLGFALLSAFISATLRKGRMSDENKRSQSIQRKAPYQYRSKCRKVR
jgi:hypothetical protein